MKEISLEALVKETGGLLEGDGSVIISGVGTIEEAGSGIITFLANQKYQKFLDDSKASAVIVPHDIPSAKGLNFIRSENPYYTFMKAVVLFHPPEPLAKPGIHATAVIGKNVQLGENVSVGPYVVIGDHSQIGSDSVLLPHAVLGKSVRVGHHCTLHAHVSLRDGVQIGNFVIIHDGAVAGSDGFGFAPESGKYYKIPQIGTVVIEDFVEIGANTTIDRATLGETRICEGVKLDNLIQIAHNCTIGAHTVIAAQTGVSGSTKIGHHVRIGGQTGFAGHLSIGNYTAIGAQSGITKSVPEKQFFFGTPAKPHREEFRIHGALKRLPGLIKEIKVIKNKIQQLEQEKDV